MGRILLLALLAVIAVWLVRRALGAARRRGAGAVPPPARTGDLVRCARCGVHLPRGEARHAEGLAYCSDEHARLGPGSGA